VSENPVQRRLAAILAADVVGYSRLMGQDETGTLATLKSLRSQIIDPKIAEHRGRIFKTTGDGLLVEFPSVVNAVVCAVEIQKDVVRRNAESPDRHALLLRIGVNLGDVIIDGDDVFGDGVNVAARLEGIASPGGIAVSGMVRDNVGNRLDVNFQDLGDHALKNIETPVRVYAVGTEPVPKASAVMARPGKSKPSIAVLPFKNMSGDPEQEYFADGISEDLITELSRFRDLHVIARNSVFAFKGKSIQTEAFRMELGVDFVVEGSVRKSGDRMRVNAQLVNTSTGTQVWADRYDRTVSDVFALQDEIVRSIAATALGRLYQDFANHVAVRKNAEIGSYELVLKARKALEAYNADIAEPLLREAIERDPGNAQAYAHLSHIYWLRSTNTHDKNQIKGDIEVAIELGRKAISIDETDSLCHAHLGLAYLFNLQHDRAEFHCRKAVELNSADVIALHFYAGMLTYSGRPAEALSVVVEAEKLDPFPTDVLLENRFIILFHLNRFEESASVILRKKQPFWWDHAYLAACYAHLGRSDDTERERETVLRLHPPMSVARFMLSEPLALEVDQERLRSGLVKAGFPS
jgi:TolB-like protein/class 3 adenylate cyclase/Tfp pilus assembly protein PilF